MAIYHSTLLLLIAVALLGPNGLFISQAHALQGVAPPPARRIDHIDMSARMVKKRGSAPVPNVPLVKRQASGTTGNGNPSATPTPSNGQGNNSQTNGNQNTSTCNGLLDCLLNGGNGNGNQQTTTTTTPPTTSASSTTSTSQTSTTQTSSPTTRANTSTQPRTTGTRTTIVTATDAPAQQSDQSQDQSASFLPKSAIIGLIVAASCVVGGAAIWTVIRKWKFSPSRHFEDRLEPINWEPTQPSGLPHDPTVAALARGAGSHHGNGSIGSSDDQHNNRNMASVHDQPISMAPDFPPPHDFTAGPAGQGGYVDMHRGPSPAPPAAANYGRYETPNPYDAYDYNAGYGQRRY